MSHKFRVEKVSDNHFVLPAIKDMKCKVDAFLSQELYEQTDEALWQQAVDSASYDGAIGMYLMPDTHLGYGIPVGGVLVTEGTIVQSGSGYDISCGVVYLRVPKLSAEDVADWDKRKAWVDEVEKRVATGLGNERPELAKRIKHKQVEEVLRYGAKALGVKADLCERQYIEVPEDLDLKKIERAHSKCVHQLGSVGGGNHFIEMQVDKDDGSVWVMIHCGSRGYGWQTANHFFYEGAALRGLPKNRREQSHLYADEPLGKEYWAYHNSAANFAVANRHTIVEGVQEALREVFAVEGEVFYEISHNLVQEETLVLPDGTTKKGFVHRKGATRAFPAGHPDLVGTKWEKTGHPCCIPGSMLSGAAILYPKDGAFQSGCSVNHGSGRTMGRAAAKRELREIHDDIDHEMKTIERELGGVLIKGIVGNTERTPLDECGHVYKDLDAVLQVLVDEGIATIAHRMYPVANIKGTD
jgi:tRNA-splicing ligase RtcB